MRLKTKPSKSWTQEERLALIEELARILRTEALTQTDISTDRVTEISEIILFVSNKTPRFLQNNRRQILNIEKNPQTINGVHAKKKKQRDY